MKKIAVLLPAYNAQKTVREAVQSILDQTYHHFDLFVINDGSTDATEEIIRSFSDPRIRLVNNPKNLGLIATLNRGLDVICSEGEYDYIARMDADDLSRPCRFEKQISYMMDHPEIDICSTGMSYSGDRRGKILFPFSPLAARYTSLCMACPVGHASSMIKTSLFQNNTVRYDPDYPHAEDARLWSILTKEHNVSNIADCLYVYHFNDGNVSVNNKEIQRHSAEKVIADDFEYFLGRKLAEREKTYILQKFKKEDFESYLSFYSDVLGRIGKYSPEFFRDAECHRLLVRLVVRTVWQNWNHIRIKEVWRMMKGFLMEEANLSFPVILGLVVRLVFLTKIMHRPNVV